MERRYPSYEDYFRQPDSLSYQPAVPIDRRPVNFDYAPMGAQNEVEMTGGGDVPPTWETWSDSRSQMHADEGCNPYSMPYREPERTRGLGETVENRHWTQGTGPAPQDDYWGRNRSSETDFLHGEYRPKHSEPIGVGDQYLSEDQIGLYHQRRPPKQHSPWEADRASSQQQYPKSDRASSSYYEHPGTNLNISKGDMGSQPQPRNDNEEKGGKGEKKGQAEEDDSEDEDTSFCKLCNTSFENPQQYYRHTRGLLHTQRQAAAAADKRQTAGEQNQEEIAPKDGSKELQMPVGKSDIKQTEKVKEGPARVSVAQPAPVEKSSAALTEKARGDNEGEQCEEEDWEDEAELEEEKGGSHSDEFVCDLCDIRTTGSYTLRAHKFGRNHLAVEKAVREGTVLAQRILCRLGPKARISNKQKPLNVLKNVKAAEGPSILMEMLKGMKEAVVGVEFVKEGLQGSLASFYCLTCDCICDTSAVLPHLIGSKHRMKYLRDHQPEIYEHVKVHGGKKSQLSAFLEEVCKDVEQKEGRKHPIMEHDYSQDKKAEKKSEEKSEERKEEGKDKADGKTGDGPPKEKGGKDFWASFGRRRLPHEVAMARYKEERRNREMGGLEYGPGWDVSNEAYEGQEFGPRGPNFRPRGHDFGPRGHDFGPRGPGFRPRDPPDFGPRGPGFGPRGPDFGPRDYDFGPRVSDFDVRVPEFGPRDHDFGQRDPGFGPRDPDFGPRDPDFGPRGIGLRHGEPDFRPRDPYFDMPRADPYPPLRKYPGPYATEEERWHCIYEYERHNFFYPEVGFGPEEARNRMLLEYEKMGIPYEVALDRVVIQESRMAMLGDFLKDGLSVEDARRKVMKIENRKRLIREYERQGLHPEEAKWRVIVEEERTKLFEKYEQEGIKPLEARAKIMAGHERMHLIREFERHGMPPEEANRRAIEEEDRLKNIESALKSGESERSGVSSRDNMLDDIADKRMLQNYMEQGDTREQAENKVIAMLRREGVPTQEAILRVQRIEVQVPQRKNSRSPLPKQYRSRSRSPSDRRGRGSPLPKQYRSRSRSPSGRRGRDSSPHRHRHDVHQKKRDSSKPDSVDYTNISPEEAKERLFQEYEKRGVPREEARLMLIQELVRSGVSLEEAERRFKDTRPIKGKQERDDHRETRGKRPVKYTGYDHRRSRSSSSSRSSRGRRSRSSSGDERRHSRSRQRERRDERSSALEKHGRSDWRDYTKSSRNERDRQQRASARDDRDHRHRSQETRSRPTLTLGEELKLKAKKLKRDADVADQRDTSLMSKQLKGAAKAEQPGSSSADTSNMPGLLETLTDNLISSEDPDIALTMSKALTSALLKYGVSTPTDEKKDRAKTASELSFVEKRITDAKKLFKMKIQPPQRKFSSTTVRQELRSTSGDKTNDRQAEESGLPSHAQPSASTSGSSAMQQPSYQQKLGADFITKTTSEQARGQDVPNETRKGLSFSFSRQKAPEKISFGRGYPRR